MVSFVAAAAIIGLCGCIGGYAVKSSHSVVLTWNPSTTSTVVGYNVYRSNVSGGSYSLLTSSSINGLTYTDSNIQSGRTYYYVVTAVDDDGAESIYSNEVSAVIPTP